MGLEREERTWGVLAVGKDSDVVQSGNGKALEESLEAEADSVDLAEVVGTGTESRAEVDAEGRVAVGKEDNRAKLAQGLGRRNRRCSKPQPWDPATGGQRRGGREHRRGTKGP